MDNEDKTEGTGPGSMLLSLVNSFGLLAQTGQNPRPMTGWRVSPRQTGKSVRGLVTKNFENFLGESRQFKKHVYQIPGKLVKNCSRSDFSKFGPLLLFLMWQHWIGQQEISL